MFGECISNEFINIIRSLKKPSILELGGGDGSLAISMCKHLKKNKSLPDKYIILEISENLINYQKERVKKEFPNDYNIFKWITNLEDIKINGLVIANEFFDALPTERFRINNSKLETLYIESNNQSFNYIWDESSNDFANEPPTSKDPNNPGPFVKATALMSCLVTFAFLIARSMNLLPSRLVPLIAKKISFFFISLTTYKLQRKIHKQNII